VGKENPRGRSFGGKFKPLAGKMDGKKSTEKTQKRWERKKEIQV